MSLLARLIEAGTPADLIEEVAMMIAEKRAADRAVEDARAKARERQARKRERDQSRDVTECHVTDCDSEATPLSAPPNDIYSNPPHLSPNSQTGARDAFPCPEWCEPAVWADLKRNRKAKRLANTATAHSQFLRDIAKLATDEWPPGEVVRDIAARGWGGAYDPRDAGKPTNGRQHSRPERSTTRQTGERVAARFAAGSGSPADIVPRLGAPGRHD